MLEKNWTMPLKLYGKIILNMKFHIQSNLINWKKFPISIQVSLTCSVSDRENIFLKRAYFNKTKNDSKKNMIKKCWILRKVDSNARSEGIFLLICSLRVHRGTNQGDMAHEQEIDIKQPSC